MADAKPKPTIVFIPGAWHSPAGFDGLLPPLHAAGYLTTAIHLPSTGVSPGLTSLDPDVKAVRDVVCGLVELGREVVIVAHSYGGVPTTEALAGLSLAQRKSSGLSGGVSHLIFISALVPRKGYNTLESMGPVKAAEDGGPTTNQVDNGDNTTSVLNGEDCFYHDVSPQIARYFSRLLTLQSSGPFSSMITYESYRDISTLYVVCTEDRALNIDTQRWMVKAAGIEAIKELPSSHSPFLSMPEKVVDIIRDFVETK